MKKSILSFVIAVAVAPMANASVLSNAVASQLIAAENAGTSTAINEAVSNFNGLSSSEQQTVIDGLNANGHSTITHQLTLVDTAAAQNASAINTLQNMAIVYPAQPQAIPQPVAQPVTAPVAQPVTAPINAPVTQLVKQADIQPVAQPVAQPVTAPVAQPVTAPVTSPVTQLVKQPAIQPVPQPEAQPITAPVAQPVTAPVLSTTTTTTTTTTAATAQTQTQPAVKADSADAVKAIAEGNTGVIATNRAIAEGNTAEIVKLQSGVEQVKATGAYAQARIDAANANIEANREAMAATNKRVSENSAAIADHESRIGALESSTNAKFGQLKDKIEDNRKRASAGIAGVAAMANIPQVIQGQTFSVGAGVGNTDSESALAVGASARASKNVVVKASVSNDTQHNFVVGAGVSYGW